MEGELIELNKKNNFVVEDVKISFKLSAGS